MLTSADSALAEYGDMTRDTNRVTAKVLGKLAQVEGEQGVIALWSDDETVEEIEADLATSDLRNNRGSYAVPSSLRYVLFASSWIRTRDVRQYWAFPLGPTPVPDAWTQELEATTESAVIEAALGRS
jgi:hypothetical protein